jgi:signal peptidase I
MGERRRMPSEKKRSRKLSPITVIITLAAGLLLLRLFVLDVMRVEGRSMEPTLRSGQIILVGRLAYGLLLPFTNSYLIQWKKPETGDLVVVPDPREGKFLVKRCIAVGGDRITMRNGRLYVRGLSFASGRNSPLHEFGAVPADHILVLGDNLSASVDSRQFGFVPTNRVIGKVVGF